MKREIPKSAWDEEESETGTKLTAGEYPAGVVVVTEFEDQTYWGWGCPRCGEHDYVGRSPRERMEEEYLRHREQCAAGGGREREAGGSP